MRIWRTSPFVAVVAVVALGAGIGFTTTMFSIVYGGTRPLPFDEPHEIVAIEKLAPEGIAPGVTPFDYEIWAGGARSLEAVGAYQPFSAPLAEAGGDPERVSGVALTANSFRMLGAGAALGRTLLPGDMAPSSPPVLVLSHGLWQRRYAGDPQIVGRTVRLAGEPHEVVGVMPPRFGFPVNTAIWTPLKMAGATDAPRLVAFGRLADDTATETARAELTALASAAYAERGLLDPRGAGLGVRVIPFQDQETPPEIVRGLYLLLLAVSFVLLIACGNVANLLLARAAVRSRDVALRLAMGATRGRIVREQLGEVLSLALVAGVLGVGLAHVGTTLFAAGTAHVIEAFWIEFRVDVTVLLFATVLAGVATLAAGLGPALRVSRGNVADILKDRAFGGTSLTLGRWSRRMIGVQVALACGLLALTMVLGKAAVSLRAVPWPFDPSEVLTFEFQLPSAVVNNPAARQLRLTAIEDAIAAAPGVEAAGLTSALPGRGAGSWTFALDADPAAGGGAALRTAVAQVTPDFFAVARMSAVRGRLLDARDAGAAPAVVVVNEAFVERFSPNRDPLGRRIRIDDRAFEIVGVVPTALPRDVEEAQQDGIYLSLLQTRPWAIRAMVRGDRDPAALVPGIREAIRRVDPDLPIAEVFSLREAVYRDKAVLDLISSLFLVFGIGALSLTAVGLYGVIAFGVTQRTREIGIRLALGASRRQILALVLGQGGRAIAVGVVAGLALAVALSRGFAAAFSHLPPADVPVLLAIAAALAATAAAALVVPATRAARLQIVHALRSE